MKSPSRFVAAVVVGVALVQTLWITVVPPFRGSDEFDHAYRAAGVASGQLRADVRPEDGRGVLVQVPPHLVDAAHDQCAALSYTGPANCSPVGDASDGLVWVGSGAGKYNPVFYWVIGTVGRPFSGASSLMAMRITGALLSLLLIGVAAWAVAVRRNSSWTRAGLLLAMPPVFYFSTAMAAPNGLEMASGLALWCLLIGLDGSVDERTERRMVLLAGVAASVLVTLRLLGPLFTLLIVGTVWLLQPALVRRLLAVHRRTVLPTALVVMACTAFNLLWIQEVGATSPGPDKEGGDWGWSSLLLWVLQTIAAFPYRDLPGPITVYPIAFAVIGVFLVAALRYAPRRGRWATGLAAVTWLGVPLALTAFTYGDFGAVWQGRYGLPYAVGVLLVAAAARECSPGVPRVQWVVPAGFALTGVTGLCLAKVRADELVRAVSAGDPAWHPPTLLLLVVVTSTAGLLLTAAAASHRDQVVPRSS